MKSADDNLTTPSSL